jgi:hypothetical protein
METLIFDSEGTLLNTLPFHGVDIVKASDADGVWMSGSHLRRVSSAGKILFERKDGTWCEPTLTTSVGSDTVWVGERSHPDVAGSANCVRRIPADGEVDLKVDLPAPAPYVVVADGPEGIWAGGGRGLRRISNRGELGPVIDIKVVAAERVPRGDGLFVASREEIHKVSATGEIVLAPKMAESRDSACKVVEVSARGMTSTAAGKPSTASSTSFVTARSSTAIRPKSRHSCCGSRTS